MWWRGRALPVVAVILNGFRGGRASGIDEGPLAAPPASDTRSNSCQLAMSMDWARSVLLGKSELGNHRVTDFLRPMTAEQKAEYDARQVVKSAAGKRRREELMLQELANEKKPGRPITRPTVMLPEQFEGEIKELLDCERAQQLDAAANPAALAASSHGDGGQASFHGHVKGEGSSELADNMAGGSGDKGASKDLPGGSGSEIGSRQVGSSERGSPLTGSDTEAVAGSDADDEIGSKPKPPRR
jgi:hypothetical protein